MTSSTSWTLSMMTRMSLAASVAAGRGLQVPAGRVPAPARWREPGRQARPSARHNRGRRGGGVTSPPPGATLSLRPRSGGCRDCRDHHKGHACAATRSSPVSRPCPPSASGQLCRCLGSAGGVNLHGARAGRRGSGRGAGAGVRAGVDEPCHGLLAPGKLEVAEAQLGASRDCRWVDRQGWVDRHGRSL